jgi:hypothetical protein
MARREAPQPWKHRQIGQAFSSQNSCLFPRKIKQSVRPRLSFVYRFNSEKEGLKCMSLTPKRPKNGGIRLGWGVLCLVVPDQTPPETGFPDRTAVLRGGLFKHTARLVVLPIQA